MRVEITAVDNDTELPKLLESEGMRMYAVNHRLEPDEGHSTVALLFDDQNTPLTPSEQQSFFQAVVDIKVNGENHHAFDEAVQMVTDRVFRNTHKREAGK